VSQENVEALKRGAALGDDDDEAWDCFHPEVEWRVINAGRLSRSGRGIDSYRKWWSPADNPAIMGEVPAEHAYVDAGDFVISVDTIPDTDIEEASLYEFRDGKVIRFTHGYPSTDAALKAAGLAE
jgi:hypothetical protein